MQRTEAVINTRRKKMLYQNEDMFMVHMMNQGTAVNNSDIVLKMYS